MPSGMGKQVRSLRSAMLGELAANHPVAIQLDLACPLIARRHLSDQLDELRPRPSEADRQTP